LSGRIHFVRAGAGSGKTYRLAEILGDALIAGDARPAGVIATTFTNKAATELRERIRKRLLDVRRFDLAIAIGEARIGTVNSVCGALVERFAFDAGLPTELAVLDEAPAQALLREAIDEVADGATIGSLDELARRLGIAEWPEALQTLVDLARANDIDADTLREIAKQNADELLRRFPKPARRDSTDALRRAIAAAVPALEAQKTTRTTGDYVIVARAIERDLAEGRACWSDWVKLSRNDVEKKLKAIAQPIADAAAGYAQHPRLHADLREYLQRIFALAAATLEAYATRKRELRAIDFTDQEHLLLRALELPAVEAALREELGLLLVDEFQDTSPIQLALFVKLAALAREVYWVGDVKQAIYGFRGSDTALMEAVLQALPDLGGVPETLDQSWRSRPALVALANAVFVPAFAGILSPEDVRLRATRRERPAEPAVANWVLEGANKAAELRALAAGVRRLVRSGATIEDPQSKDVRPVRFGDIAILVRTNDTVSDAAAALTAAGIPVATAEPGLLETPEAVLALACLRRLHDPADTLATAEILALADAEPPEQWIDERLAYLQDGGDSVGWRESGPRRHPILERLRDLRPRLPLIAPHEALELVITHAELAGRVVRWQPDAQRMRRRLANLDALVELARQYEDQARHRREAATVAGLILWLDEQRAGGLDARATPSVDAVQVLTHHRAKGLEWPVVILKDLAAKIQDRLWGLSAESRGPVAFAQPLRDRFIRYWPWPFGQIERAAPADEIAMSPEGRRARAAAIDEAKRLLYVSITRARDLLVLARSSRHPTGEWIDTLDAPWLLTRPGDTEMALPSGERIACAHWRLEPEGPPAGDPAAATETQWFRTLAPIEPRRPQMLHPSAIEAPAATVLERARIGERIELTRTLDMAAVGNALHGCIAASLTDPAAPLAVPEVASLLGAFGVGDGLSADAVVRQIAALRGWLDGRWPGAKAYAEVPVEAVLPNGQILAGRVDLLLRVEQGWLLFDHKANPQGADHWDEVALTHAGQLRAYADAIEGATGEKVLEAWVYFPVSAGAVRVSWGRRHGASA